MIRAFIAANLAVSIVEEIAKIQSFLREGQGDIRWARPEGFHLTLKFLGNMHEAKVEPILHVLRETLKTQPTMRIRTHGLDAFPTLKRPRVLLTRLSGEGLSELGERIESALMPLGFPAGGRAFRPHITLGRLRSQRGWDRVLAKIKEHLQQDFSESIIDTLTLYESDLQPGGAVYTPLGSVALSVA